MPNYIRWRKGGAVYFFTVVTCRRRRLLDQPLARKLLHAAIADVREILPFQMPACVLLPDHLHCIWQLPRDDDDFPERWKRIKSEFTRKFLAHGGTEFATTSGQRRQGRRGVWQPRYWEHRIEDEEEYLGYRDYIHLNPVNHGYVGKPISWAWSSIHEHIRNRWLDPEWPGNGPVNLPHVEE